MDNETWTELEALKAASPEKARQLLASPKYRDVLYPPPGETSPDGAVHYASVPSHDGNDNLTAYGRLQVEKGALLRIVHGSRR